MMNEVRGELFLRRLPPEIRDGLNPVQQAAIRAAAGTRDSEAGRIDLRFSLPTPWGWYYVVLVTGRDRRSPARRRRDRQQRPLLLASAGTIRRLKGTLLALFLLGGLLVYGAVAEF